MHRTSPSRAFAGLAITYFALSLAATPGVLAATQNRITTNITLGTRTDIADSVQPRARAAADLGPASGDMKLTGMSLRFAMTATQSAALDQLLIDQQNPASPRYHQWLSPAEFGDQFGLSQADIAKVTEWLTQQGFTVTGVANSSTFVTFDGTVAQAEAAFGTSIHNLSVNGENHFANITDVTVPAALSGVVGGVLGLHDFRVHPHAHAVAHPQFTSSVSGSHFLAPGDLYAIYDMEPLLTGGFTGAGIGTGANCHSVASAPCGDIAVVGRVDLTASNADVLAFRTAAGLSTTNLPSTVHADGVTHPVQTCSNCSPSAGDLQESSLDVEWAGAMAPGASILFVNSRCVLPGANCGTDAMSYAIDNNVAPIISSSYGNCEAAWGSNDMGSTNLLFKQAAAQGQTVIASSGDSGAADCDAAVPAIEGLTVDFPASSPYVLSMGGTMFNEGSATGATQYWASPDTTFSAGTTVPSADISAKSYIPEAVWNEDDTVIGDGFSAGGGGKSAFFSKPYWQVETGAAGMTTSVPADSSRDVPDIALDAAAGHDSYLFCYSNSCVSGFRQSANGNLTVAGGTSFDSQIFGGMLAVIEQKLGSRIGMANPTLYALGNSATYYNNTAGSVFHDVTSGNNSDPCTGGTPDCPNGSTIGYSAASGYDLATGWGSVDLNNLAGAWSWGTSHPVGTLSTGTTISTTTLITTPACTNPTGSNSSNSPCTASVTTGSSITLTATVTGLSGVPTGTVQFLDNGAALGAKVTLNSSGVATYSYNATCSALGQQNMSAVYSGDGTYAGSKGPALAVSQATASGGTTLSSNGSVNTNPLIVNVTSTTCPDFTVASSGTSTSTATITTSGGTTSVTVAANGTIPPLTLTVAPANGFVGTVSFTASVVSTTGYVPTFTFSPPSLTFTTSSSASQTTSMSLSGITADLQMPARPGKTSPNQPWYAAGGGVAIASLFLVFFPRRRRLGGLLVLALAGIVAAGATGCGGSSVSSTPSGGTPAVNPYIGTYQVTVIATYSSSGQTDTHSSVITYTIN